jgi:hypothetical protein
MGADSMTPEPPALRSSTHVALDAITSERLLGLGAVNVVRASSRLTVGPSRRDVAEHRRAREQWWNAPEKWDQLYSPKVRWAPPVVVWASAGIVDRVNLWRVCHHLRHLGIPARDVFLLDFEAAPPSRAPEEPAAAFDGTSSVADWSDDVLTDRLARAHPCVRTRYERAAALWEKYTDEDPRPLVRACLRGAEGFPELAALWAYLSCFFPRAAPEGTMRLGRFDELLVTVLSEQWQTPVDIVVHRSQAGAELRRLISCTGDLFIPRRLEQWAAHGPHNAVDRAAGPKSPDNPMMASVYRITASGAQIRERGLLQVSGAPPLPVGGAEAYCPRSPWVLLPGGRLALPRRTPGA